MRKQLSATRLTLIQKRNAFFLAVGVVLLFSSFADAQSGRRPPKRTEQEGVQRPSEPQRPIKPETKEPEKERIPVLIGKLNSYYRSNFFTDYVVEGCAERLKKTATLAIEKSLGEMNRKEASDAAKSNARYVVLLELRSERMGYDGRRESQYYLDDAVIDYTVFAPGTGKVKSSGRVYPTRPRSTVGLPLPAPSGGPAAAEYILKQAGRDVADRVIDSLRAVDASWK